MVCVLFVEVVCFVFRDVGSFGLLRQEPLPIKVFEPWVLHDFLSSIAAQSFAWFPLQALVHEINNTCIPTQRSVCLLEFHLLVQHLLFQLLSRPALVRSSAEHQLMADDTESIVVGFIAVILFEDDLWSHVAWCA